MIRRLALPLLAAFSLAGQVPIGPPAPTPELARQEGSVVAGDPIRFTYFFRNQPGASAAARQVVVQTVLDPGLVPESVTFSEIEWGDTVVPLAPGARSYSGRLPARDHRPGAARPLETEVRCGFSDARTVTWVFVTIDPRTGREPADPEAGFLPPEDGSHRGEGLVSFSVRTRPDLPPWSRVRNHATIAFDHVPPVRTVPTVHGILASPRPLATPPSRPR